VKGVILMPKRVTQEEFQERVSRNSDDFYEVLTPYQGRNEKVTLKCKKHLCEFTLTADAVSRRKAISCPECKKENSEAQRAKVFCAYCNKEFSIIPSKLNESKSGLHFCCREHKDLAQRVSFGLTAIQPAHYGTGNGISSYRKNTLETRPHKCEVCGYDEDVDLLEVHHIDKNRAHNNSENLVLLCALCHKKLTTNKYQLINNGERDCMEWSLLLQGS